MTGTQAVDTTISNSLTLPSEYTLEVDANFTSYGWSGSIAVEDIFIGLDSNSDWRVYTLSTISPLQNLGRCTQKTGTIKFVRQGTSITIYWNSSLIGTINNVSTTNHYAFKSYNTRTLTLKNLKIKPL